jgi:thiosulfate reductase/polysulfide reductase chain A
MFDSKPGNQIAKMITEKWGIHGAFPPSVEKGLDKKLKLVGSSLAEIRKKGVLVMPETDLYRKPGEALNLKTPSGKVELASARLEAGGFDAVPRYTPHPEPPSGFYRMLTGRKPMLTFGRTANNRFLGDLATAKENEVWVNNRIAEKHSLENGEYVHLKNQEGVVSEFPVKVKVTQRIRTDAVYMVHGFGHTSAKLTWAHKRGASHNQLISKTEIDPAMGAVGFQNNFVTFIKEA